jgi:hypothetical protein
MLDDEFHRLMASTTRNRMLESQSGRVLDRAIMARMMVREEPGRTEEIAHEHQAILDALGATPRRPPSRPLCTSGTITAAASANSPPAAATSGARCADPDLMLRPGRAFPAQCAGSGTS